MAFPSILQTWRLKRRRALLCAIYCGGDLRAGGSAGRTLHQIARPHQEEQTQEPTHLLLAEVFKETPSENVVGLGEMSPSRGEE